MRRFTPRHPEWQDVPETRWTDWRWQQQNRVTSLDRLASLIALTPEERDAFEACADRFRVAITPYYLSLIGPSGCPVRAQAVPAPGELETGPGERADPLAEEAHMPVPGLTHRYPDRALIYATHNCPVYCRFCTRKRKVGDPASQHARPELMDAVAYVAATPEIRDVIVSGGDPLSLSNERLGELLDALAAIDHVDVVRIGTRNPVTLPWRVDEGLCARIEAVQRAGRAAIWVMTHFNHVAECTVEAAAACDRLLRTGTTVCNQMVLLKGVNDRPEDVEALNRRLLRMRVKPYYIIHADMAEGVGHFRTSVDAGVEILRALRGRVSGLAIPSFVIDLPGGGGKVPLTPEYEVRRADGVRVFRSHRGEFELPE